MAADEGRTRGTFTELARAKVNLTLRVLGRRPDGYHELESLVVFADVADVVELTIGPAPCVTSHGPFGGDIAGENLVSQTLSRLAVVEPRLRLGAIAIEKNLPVAAGLGGGSADAAAALRALERANPDLQTPSTGASSPPGSGPMCLSASRTLLR